MEWHIEGAYIAACSCNVTEHWKIDHTLNDTKGGCKGIVIFRINEGFLKGTTQNPDLSGVDFAMVNFFPAKFSTDEFWEMGIIVDERATDEQARAVEQIVSGRHGGPFSDIQGMIGEFLGMERNAIGVERAQAPIVRVAGVITFRFQPNVDAAGEPAPSGSPMFAFGTERLGGKAEGPPARVFGSVLTPNFAEYAKFNLDHGSSSMDEHLKGLRGYTSA